MAGNIDVETGGTFNYKQQQSGGGPGYGLFQMEAPMRSAYNSYLSKNRMTDSAASQVAFAHNEVQVGSYIGAGNAQKIRAAFGSGNIDTATTVFCNVFERPSIPHLDRRIAAAKKIYSGQKK